MRKEGIEEENHVLSTLALMGEVILDQRQAKLAENKDAGSVTKSGRFGN